MQSKLWLCHCKLRLPAILTASQKCSCKQAFLLYGRIAGSLQGKPVHIRFVENNFAFSAARKKHKDTFLFSYFCMTKRRAQGGGATSEHEVYQKVAFVPYGETIALFTDEKRRKSHQRKAHRPPLQTTSHPVELAAGSNARQACATDSKSQNSSISLRISSAIPRVRTQYPAKNEQIRRGGWFRAKAVAASRFS